MPKQDLPEIVVILDRSGSMSSIREDAIGGFNTFIEDQRKEPGEATVTLVQFDHEYEEVYGGKCLKEVPLLDGATYVPRGQTALLDAMGRAINKVGARLAKMQEEEKPAKVICVTITDGRENASQEFKQKGVKEMVEHQRDKYSWEFIFLAADPTTMELAESIGVTRGNVARFVASGAGMQRGYHIGTKAVSNYRSGKGDSSNLLDPQMDSTVTETSTNQPSKE